MDDSLENFIYFILRDIKSLDSDISQLVDKNFWNLCTDQ